MPPNSRSKIFISYSQKDSEYLNRLKTHLAPYERAGLVEVWDDQRIKIGQDWRKEIEKALASAKVAILLVSVDFLASQFISDNELPPLLQSANEGGTTIMPVIVGTCNFQETELSRYQAANPPSKPLKRMSQDEQDEVWLHVAKQAKEALNGTPIPETPKYSQEELIDRRYRANARLDQAAESMNKGHWTTAITQTNQAVELCPDKEIDSHSQLALRMSQAVREEFLGDPLRSPDTYGPSIMRIGQNLSIIGYDSGRQDPPTIADTIAQLERALTLHGGHGESLQIELAATYGLDGQSERMWEILVDTLTRYPDARSTLQDVAYLVSLINGCLTEANPIEAIQQLGKMLGKSLPLSKATMVAATKNIDLTGAWFHPHIEWYVVAKPDFTATTGSSLPCFITAADFFCIDGQGKRMIQARIPVPGSLEQHPSDGWNLAERVIAELMKCFWFIAQK